LTPVEIDTRQGAERLAHWEVEVDHRNHAGSARLKQVPFSRGRRGRPRVAPQGAWRILGSAGPRPNPLTNPLAVRSILDGLHLDSESFLSRIEPDSARTISRPPMPVRAASALPLISLSLSAAAAPLGRPPSATPSRVIEA